MDKLKKHWTETSLENFLHRIASDFVNQIEQAMDAAGTSQAQLAKALGVSESRVSQVLNNPGNLTLRKLIEYSRALKKKVAIVAYDDDDPHNQNGPVNSGVFAACWEQAGRPTDFFEMAAAQGPMSYGHIESYPLTGDNTGYTKHSLQELETDSTPATPGREIRSYAGNEANSL
jgi:transcriptional regulator with XRE-family HTH domain